ncbi:MULTISPECIES: hypothetical protein [Gordonia]|uniref:hypothetical protein n=1 Tax=Gordonia TaxID=2053 RepID=UPI00258115BB|nr:MULTISPECIES: hypothetical protein [Gordonia]
MSDLRTQLTSIYQEQGELTPQSVVDVARNGEHPLHSRFEWDNEVAGEAYRRVQAAELIRSVRITYKETPESGARSVRAFSSLNDSADPTRKGYAPTEELVENELTRKILLRNLEREINSLKAKYGHLQEFADLMSEAAS